MDDDTLSLEVILRSVLPPEYHKRIIKIIYNPGNSFQPNFHIVSFELDKSVFILNSPYLRNKNFPAQWHFSVDDSLQTATSGKGDWVFSKSRKYSSKNLEIMDLDDG